MASRDDMVHAQLLCLSLILLRLSWSVWQEHRPRQVPSASHATDADLSQWSRVNAQLERCGFERIRVRGEGQMIRGASAGMPGGTSLLETLEQVLEAHESRRERLEESIRETALAAQRAVQAEYHARIAQVSQLHNTPCFTLMIHEARMHACSK
eukprot:5863617-Pleurochrysis_carterae.AAC.3